MSIAQQEQALIGAKDKRDVLEAAGAAAFGFATLHEYIQWRESKGINVGWIEKFLVMFFTTAVIFLLLRMLIKRFWPRPKESWSQGKELRG